MLDITYIWRKIEIDYNSDIGWRYPCFGYQKIIYPSILSDGK